jgi:hypothetical protein
MTGSDICLLGNRRLWLILILFIFGLGQLLGLRPAQAQEQGDSQVQELSGRIVLGEPNKVYLLSDLKQGQTLYVYMQGTSGNLDPLVGVLESDADVDTLGIEFRTAVEEAVVKGEDPLAVIPEFAEQAFLAWDDDSGQGYAAALEFPVPADGDYLLMAGDAPFPGTFGQYRLLIGLDAPQVLTGQAEPTGDILAVGYGELGGRGVEVEVAVQELTETLVADKESTFYNLDDVSPGDTFYAFVEAVSGDLAPTLVLRDFGDKPLASANVGGQETSAALQYTFEEGGPNFRLAIERGGSGVSAQQELDQATEDVAGSETEDRDEEITPDTYRLLAGLNAPEVLTGQAETVGRRILREPIKVKVGVRLQQITGVDQQAENYGAVVGLRMEWDDSRLAFSPDSCDCRFKLFTQKDFDKFITLTGGDWPEFTLFNQQNNRWTQNQLVVIDTSGHATYFERFTTTFQAPDFDFRQFPFDAQQFYIRVDAIYPEEYLVFSNLEEFTAVGTQLGEEEWYITNSDTQVTSETATTGNATSRYSFHFEARRHLTFYIFRIFVPLFLIITVAWITFFLKDYSRRIEATSANLLLFIAFNFTIASSLPRLGYLTFLDTILMAAFLISVLIVLYNTYLKWLEVSDHKDRAERIDRYMIWLYPLGYALAFGVVALLFFVMQPPLLTA